MRQVGHLQVLPYRRVTLSKQTNVGVTQDEAADFDDIHIALLKILG